MMVLRLEYDFSVMTLNKYISKERMNRLAAAKIKRRSTTMVQIATYDQARGHYLDDLYDVHVLWMVPNRKVDPDNVYFGIKFVLDGIVRAGVLADDSRKHIRRIHHDIETGKPGIVVEFHKSEK